ncbi:MAG: protein kinase [Sandaracinaceae bacterium]|nr:protein kinase [Sandaracinaceae bacterium]
MNNKPSVSVSGDVSRTRVMARVGTTLGAPIILAACVVTLVATVGLLATASSYLTLKQAGHERADAWLDGRRAHLEGTLEQAFGVADPLLDHLAAFVRGQPGDDRVDGLVPRLHALAAGRTGVTWVSVSYPDGTFVGVSRGEDGRFEAQATTVETWDDPNATDAERAATGVERRLALDERGRVRERSRALSAYDPRRRPFYELAVRERARVWTEPYTFLPDWRTGVTRVEPVYQSDAPGAPLIAVLTVDFDAEELTQLLGAPVYADKRTLVVTSGGVVLAAHGVALDELAADLDPSERPVPTLAAITDPVVVAMRSLFGAGDERVAAAMTVAGEAYRYDARVVANLSGQRVLLLTAVPERELYRAAHQQALRGALTTGALTLLGLLLAFAISASLAHHRRKRRLAEAAAQRAREQVRQLGRYELVSLLGAGAMGEVYRARHTLLARDAALKLIKWRDLSRGSDATGELEARMEERRQRFFDEAQRLASLHSLHTVSVHDFGVSEDGRYFLVMELLDGLDLASLVAYDGPQAPARVAAILAQVCDSLAEAHEGGLVHQDIKPGNVFLCRIAEALDFVKVLDFGLARAVGQPGDVGTPHTIEGTPAYMAPEQILGEPIGPAVDLYALGGLGFFLLTGQPPYPGSHREGLFAQHVHGPLPTLPEDVAKHTPRALAQLLTRCLAKQPDHRPSSARVLAEVLRKIAAEHAEEWSAEDRQRWWAKLEQERPAKPEDDHVPSALPVRIDAAHSMRRRSA